VGESKRNSATKDAEQAPDESADSARRLASAWRSIEDRAFGLALNENQHWCTTRAALRSQANF
jgi:hypothetical protein